MLDSNSCVNSVKSKTPGQKPTNRSMPLVLVVVRGSSHVRVLQHYNRLEVLAHDPRSPYSMPGEADGDE